MSDISVIIPVYNRPTLLEQSLDSVFKQSYDNYEILVIDDGSTQPIVNLEKLDSRIRVIRHEQNKGAPAARNTGIQHARGELLAFLDSDDSWLPSKLAVQSTWMHTHPEIAATTTGFYYNSEEGNGIEIPPNQKDWYRYFMRGISLAPGTNLMVWRHIMLDYLFDETYPRLEDLDLALRISKNHQFWVIQQPLAIINRGKHPPAYMVEESDLLLIKKHATDFQQQGWFYGHYCIAKRYLEISTHYFREKKHPQGWAYLWKTIRTNPFQRPSMYLRIFDYIFGTSFLKILKSLHNKIFYSSKLPNKNNSSHP